MSELLDRIANAILAEAYKTGGVYLSPAIAKATARAAIEIMRSPTEAMVERAAKAMRDYEFQHKVEGVVKWERLNEKIKQHFRGKVRVVVDAVGI